MEDDCKIIKWLIPQWSFILYSVISAGYLALTILVSYVILRKMFNNNVYTHSILVMMINNALNACLIQVILLLYMMCTFGPNPALYLIISLFYKVSNNYSRLLLIFTTFTRYVAIKYRRYSSENIYGRIRKMTIRTSNLFLLYVIALIITVAFEFNWILIDTLYRLPKEFKLTHLVVSTVHPFYNFVKFVLLYVLVIVFMITSYIRLFIYVRKASMAHNATPILLERKDTTRSKQNSDKRKTSSSSFDNLMKKSKKLVDRNYNEGNKPSTRTKSDKMVMSIGINALLICIFFIVFRFPAEYYQMLLAVSRLNWLDKQREHTHPKIITVLIFMTFIYPVLEGIMVIFTYKALVKQISRIVRRKKTILHVDRSVLKDMF